ncbi:LacI family DNA-binding transcriptional regulator [Gordonia soli]|uniref:Putative LacI family transcriptional regulator n=1 Tax=Gordonia soli NBRC 108243 TaxID=1223545 RepID=M0QE45_9ACTN|nr:LacI family DNA-binding transcriptional regulator [Gordonia soli]GAC66719.1 putative LacI family transcriptional regulator [Gordonia soli NBRC 108243]
MPQAPRKRPTLVDVAAAAGVSKALVSIVMRGVPGASDETRARVFRIADELGYVPDQRARKLRQSSSGLLGVTFELREPFHGDLVEELYSAAADAGFDLVISAVAPSRSERAAIEALMRERVEGVIMVGPRAGEDVVAGWTAQFPITVVAREIRTPTVGSVRGDDAAGVELAVDHLVALGHADIAHVDGGDAPGADDRRDGFRAAMARHRKKGRARVVPGGLHHADGAQAMRAILDSGRVPTAVVAFNDECAGGVVDTLIRAGFSVPTDISVVGYDDARLATRMAEPLTTVAQDAAAFAAHAVAGLVTMLGGGTPPRVVESPHLVVRATTAPPTPRIPDSRTNHTR